MEPDSSEATRPEGHGKRSRRDRLHAKKGLARRKNVQGKEPAVHDCAVAGKVDKSGKRVGNKSSRAVVKKDRNFGPDILAGHMASVAKQLNDMLGEIRSVRQLLDDEIRRSGQDHDEQIGLKKDVEAVQTKIGIIERNIQEKMVEIERHVQEKLNALEEVLKEARKKKWEIAVAIISAFITAIAGMIILRVFPTSTTQAPPPILPPDPKPHSAIYSPAEPRPFLFLRGEDRGTKNPSC